MTSCPICYSTEFPVALLYGCQHIVCGICGLTDRYFNKRFRCLVCQEDKDAILVDQLNLAEYQELLIHNNFSQGKLVLDQKLQIYIHKSTIDFLYELIHPQCAICNLQFKFKDLVAHMKVDHDRYFCDICLRDKPLFNAFQEVYNKHEIKKHHKGHSRCVFCSKLFYNTEFLTMHMKQKHVQCELCKKAGEASSFWETMKDLNNHCRNSHYSCSICENGLFYFLTKVEYLEHQLSFHQGFLTYEEVFGMQQEISNKQLEIIDCSRFSIVQKILPEVTLDDTLIMYGQDGDIENRQAIDDVQNNRSLQKNTYNKQVINNVNKLFYHTRQQSQVLFKQQQQVKSRKPTIQKAEPTCKLQTIFVNKITQPDYSNFIVISQIMINNHVFELAGIRFSDGIISASFHFINQILYQNKELLKKRIINKQKIGINSSTDVYSNDLDCDKFLNQFAIASIQQLKQMKNDYSSYGAKQVDIKIISEKQQFEPCKVICQLNNEFDMQYPSVQQLFSQNQKYIAFCNQTHKLSQQCDSHKQTNFYCCQNELILHSLLIETVIKERQLSTKVVSQNLETKQVDNQFIEYFKVEQPKQEQRQQKYHQDEGLTIVVKSQNEKLLVNFVNEENTYEDDSDGNLEPQSNKFNYLQRVVLDDCSQTKKLVCQQKTQAKHKKGTKQNSKLNLNKQQALLLNNQSLTNISEELIWSICDVRILGGLAIFVLIIVLYTKFWEIF